MQALWFVGSWLVIVAATVCGYLAARRWGRRALGVSIGLCVAVILARGFCLFFPDIEYRLLPYDWYADVRLILAFPVASLFLGTAIPLVQTRAVRLLALALALFIPLFEGLLVVVTLRMDHARLTGRPGTDGVVLQSSPYSCGAAAAATFLNRIGVPCDERRMAELCQTNAMTGTDLFLVCRGLRRALAGKGLRVGLVRAGWEELRQTPLPALATVRLSWRIDHWVVVLAVGPDAVTVGDPLRGLRTLSRRAFLEDWRGVLVTVTPPAP
ncbi:MAG: hypothetical protein KA419_03755 [Acidobacteria bacterium]|nr:hypothetical protein [Acidobacteriota bacterium]